MKHPSEADLALFAGGELPWWRRWLVARHRDRCERCRHEAAAFGEDVRLAREAGAELPAELHWDRLAAEMKANIQVGLAAGECVTAAGAPPRLSWRAAVALASLTLAVISGWWLHTPRPRASPAVSAEGVLLKATAGGIELAQAGRALTLMHESSEPVVLSVSVEGAITAHYVDDETGMVTINNVYSQ